MSALADFAAAVRECEAAGGDALRRHVDETRRVCRLAYHSEAFPDLEKRYAASLAEITPPEALNFARDAGATGV